jgi:mannose-6-phosphate isomerase-like protein (cupin superfamily)
LPADGGRATLVRSIGGPPRRPSIIRPNEGREYPMGRMRAVFKADGDETGNAYSLSEWWLEPRTRGAPRHRHEEDHVFYVIEGTLSVRVDDDWSDAAAGSYVIVPGGTPHSFENRSGTRTGFIALNVPGGFEARVPDIAEALPSVDLRL